MKEFKCESVRTKRENRTMAVKRYQQGFEKWKWSWLNNNTQKAEIKQSWEYSMTKVKSLRSKPICTSEPHKSSEFAQNRKLKWLGQGMRMKTRLKAAERPTQVPKRLQFSTLVEDWRFCQFSLEHIRLIRKWKLGTSVKTVALSEIIYTEEGDPT